MTDDTLLEDRQWIQLGAILVALGVVFIVIGSILAIVDPPDPPLPPTADYGGYLPRYQGPGTTTPGGRGGPICRVTTLADNQPDTFIEGAGTIRQCTGRRPGCDGTAARCARFALLEVSGTVDLLNGLGVLYVEDPFLTLACQTAPTGREGTGDAGVGGFTLKGSMTIHTHDLVIQHCRVRLLKSWGEAMTINIGDPITEAWLGHDVVLDHVSVSWSTISGNVSMNYGATNVALLDSLLAEGIRQYPNDGSYGYGALFYSHNECRLVIARTYFAHEGVRSPLLGSGCEAALLDSVMYDNGDNYWASQGDAMAGNAISIQGGGPNYSQDPFEIVIAGNTIVNGPTTSNTLTKSVGVYLEPVYLGPAHKLYLAGNTGPGITASDQTTGVQYFQVATPSVLCSQACFEAGFQWFHGFQYARLPAGAVPGYVLENAGAFPTDRDAVDVRLVRDYTDRTGDAKLDSEMDVGGHPPIAARRRAITGLPANPNAIHTATPFGRGFRTELEYFLAKDPAFGSERLEPGAAPVQRRGPSPVWLFALAVVLLRLGLWARAHGRRLPS